MSPLCRFQPLPSRVAPRGLLAIPSFFLLLVPALLLAFATPAAATRMGSDPGWDDDRRCDDRCDGFGHWGDRSLPGISLARLVEGGGSFTSGNGELVFGNFAAETTGIATEHLGRYRVVPIEDGFRLKTPLISFLGKDAGLELTYSVDASDGLLVDSASLTFRSLALIGKTSATSTLLDETTSLGELSVHKRGLFGHARTLDHLVLTNAVSGLTAETWVTLDTGLFAGTKSVTQHFGTTVIPEPTSTVLMGLGLIGLALAGRRVAQ